MESAAADAELTLTYSSDSNNNSPDPSPLPSPQIIPKKPLASTEEALNNSSTNLLPVEDLTDNNGEEEGDTTKIDIDSSNGSICNPLLTMANTLLTPILNKCLNRKVFADKLAQHPLLFALSTNGRYVFMGLLAVYTVFLLAIWIPLWIFARIISEKGVYLFLLVSLIYGGRCLLRLLAFPGTNFKVYGEVELEFAKYSCKMLDGGCGALEDFGKSIRAGASTNATRAKSSAVLGDDENEGWSVADVPATYKRMVVYRDRVFGVYWQVLHCLLEENGHGYDPLTRSKNTAGSDGNRFYGMDAAVACKRNLCCERSNDVSDGGIDSSEGIQLGNASNSNSAKSTKYGNNPLVGDIGNMLSLSPKARDDARALYIFLTSVLDDLSTLISSSSTLLRHLDNKASLKNTTISEETVKYATILIQRAGELRTFLSGMKPPSASASPFASPSSDDDEEVHDEESEVGANAVRHRLEENGSSASSSTVGMVRNAVEAFMNMLDPPPHKYIFGLDVIRGCFLARYRGARQSWVETSNGGIDVIMIPSSPVGSKSESFESRIPLSPRPGRDSGGISSSAGGRKGGRKAVLYCNPNAGLSEVSTGLGLIGGNVDQDDSDKEATCWTEYYIGHGYDVYLFNYAGYGRSYGGRRCNANSTEFTPGVFGTMRRILFSTFFGFKPSSESLKSDATAVARHILEVEGVNQLIIHGESIGGMAAAGAARSLSTSTSTSVTNQTGSVSLLVCDRTFCNLEGVAQRLVGAWTGNAIKLLTPTWSTDVAADFLAAKCPKIVANDAFDEIIHDFASLKSGLAFAGELTRGTTNNLGWIMSPPEEYRMADLENISVSDSSSVTFQSFQLSPPSWPADKHFTWKESFHFAACVRRIGKLATVAKKKMPELVDDASDDEEGVEVSDEYPSSTSSLMSSTNNTPTTSVSLEASAMISLWNTLACCDGLCGRPLGHAVKEGFDCTVSWLCCAVVFGGQRVAKEAEKRWNKRTLDSDGNVVLPEDFDFRPRGYRRDEDIAMKHPVPFPEVLSTLNDMNSKNNLLKEVETELSYIIGVLEYVVQRVSSKEYVALALKRRNGREDDHGTISTGCFLNLHCGHNNQFSSSEREELMTLIRKACGDPV